MPFNLNFIWTFSVTKCIQNTFVANYFNYNRASTSDLILQALPLLQLNPKADVEEAVASSGNQHA